MRQILRLLREEHSRVEYAARVEREFDSVHGVYVDRGAVEINPAAFRPADAVSGTDAASASGDAGTVSVNVSTSCGGTSSRST